MSSVNLSASSIAFICIVIELLGYSLNISSGLEVGRAGLVSDYLVVLLYCV